MGTLRRANSSSRLRDVRSDDDQRGVMGDCLTSERTSTNLQAAQASRKLQILDACARFLSRSLPRGTFDKDSRHQRFAGLRVGIVRVGAWNGMTLE